MKGLPTREESKLHPSDELIREVGDKVGGFEAGLVEGLFRKSLALLHTLWAADRIGKRLPSNAKRRNLLSDTISQLLSWSDSFDFEALDDTLGLSQELLNAVLGPLIGIAKVLVSHVSREDSTALLFGMSKVDQLRVLIKEVECAFCDPSEEAVEDFSSEYDSEAEVENTISNPVTRHSQLREHHYYEMNKYSRCLKDLAPLLEEAIVHGFSEDNAARYPLGLALPLAKLPGNSKPFMSLIYDKFPNANTEIVKRLAEACWNRYFILRNRIRKGPDPNSNVYPEKCDASEAPTLSKIHGPSARPPKTPFEVETDDTFECTFCQQWVPVGLINSRLKWKKDFFGSRDDLINHESSFHRSLFQKLEKEPSQPASERHVVPQSTTAQETETGSFAIELKVPDDSQIIEKCPLCKQDLELAIKDRMNHLCQHMESIALMSLPPEAIVDQNEDELVEENEDKFSASASIRSPAKSSRELMSVAKRKSDIDWFFRFLDWTYLWEEEEEDKARQYPPTVSFSNSHRTKKAQSNETPHDSPGARSDAHECMVGKPGFPSPAPPCPTKSRFTAEDDYKLKHLKENTTLSWRQIADFFPERRSGTLQVRYYTKLKERVQAPWTDGAVSLLLSQNAGNSSSSGKMKAPIVHQAQKWAKKPVETGGLRKHNESAQSDTNRERQSDQEALEQRQKELLTKALDTSKQEKDDGKEPRRIRKSWSGLS